MAFPRWGKAEIVEQLTTFFETQSLTRVNKEMKCSTCGFAMVWVEGCFWLYGTNNEWRIPMPCCKECEPELLKSLNISRVAA